MEETLKSKMRIPARGSSSCGRVRSPVRSVVVSALLLGGCAMAPVHVHRGHDAAEHMELLTRALTADTSRREQMWQSVQQEEPGPRATLHRALLRTVTGHSGYDLVAAEIELQGVLAQSPPPDVAPVARARLEDLRASSACRQEVETLKRRLSKVADIEKRLDQERR